MLFRVKIHNLEYDNCIGSVYTVVLLGGNLATALYSDMKVPYNISRVYYDHKVLNLSKS